MKRFALQNYGDIPGSNPSLVVAFSNLLQEFGRQLDPMVLGRILAPDGEITWESLSRHIGTVQIDSTAQAVNWPPSNLSIIQLHRAHPETGEPVPHYCLVADYEAQTIVDSLDGQVKESNTYGAPTAWASYILIEPSKIAAEIPAVDTEPAQEAPLRADRNYIWKAGDTIWEVARKLQYSAKELMEHNDIEDSENIKSGFALHLPFARPAVEDRPITYEIFEPARQMHVAHSHGVKKFSFGNARKWKDIKVTGHTFPDQTNLEIVGAAHVPIEEKGEVADAVYYMDALAFGNFVETGLPAFTIGFNHSHLAEGHVEPRPKPVPRKKEIPGIDDSLQDKMDAYNALVEAHPENFPNQYKTTQLGLNSEHQPVLYVARQDIMVHDLDGKRQPRLLPRNTGVWIQTTFVKDGVKYGRPPEAIKNGLWLGIPMNLLILDSELYNTKLDLPDRVALKKLTPIERYWWTPLARSAAIVTRAKTLLGKQNKK